LQFGWMILSHGFIDELGKSPYRMMLEKATPSRPRKTFCMYGCMCSTTAHGKWTVRHHPYQMQPRE
jgi:hypothetical protein